MTAPMNGIQKTRKDNLRLILDSDFGGNQTRLADALEYNQPSLVSRLLSKRANSSKNIGDKTARKIEVLAKKPAYWLDESHVAAREKGASYLDAIIKIRQAPVISWSQIRGWNSMPQRAEVELDELLPCPIQCSANTYVVKVRGISMSPKFQDGEYIFVDPDVEPTHGCFVIADIADDQEPVFRQIVIEGARRLLRPLNSQWPEPMIELSGHMKLLGVVIFKGEKL